MIKNFFYLFAVLGAVCLVAASCDNTADPNTPITVYGCMDNQSLNYNPKATKDNGSCIYTRSTQDPANALIEVFTGVRATRDSIFQSTVNNIFTSNTGRIVIINIHAGPYAIPKINWPDYTSLYGQIYADTAGEGQPFTEYPGALVNRYHFDDVPSVSTYKQIDGDQYGLLYRQGIFPACNDRMAKEAPLNMGIATYWSESNRKLTVLVETYYTKTDSLPNYINVALLENNLIGKQLSTTDTIDAYDHDYVLRYMFTGQWGEVITETSSGKRTQFKYSFTVPSTYDITNCEVAAYVCQDVGGRKINVLNAVRKKAKLF